MFPVRVPVVMVVELVPSDNAKDNVPAWEKVEPAMVTVSLPVPPTMLLMPPDKLTAPLMPREFVPSPRLTVNPWELVVVNEGPPRLTVSSPAPVLTLSDASVAVVPRIENESAPVPPVYCRMLLVSVPVVMFVVLVPSDSAKENVPTFARDVPPMVTVSAPVPPITRLVPPPKLAAPAMLSEFVPSPRFTVNPLEEVTFKEVPPRLTVSSPPAVVTERDAKVAFVPAMLNESATAPPV